MHAFEHLGCMLITADHVERSVHLGLAGVPIAAVPLLGVVNMPCLSMVLTLSRVSALSTLCYLDKPVAF